MYKKKYNWEGIQNYYNKGNSYSDIMKNFGCSSAAIAKAIKRGDLKLRNKSEAVKLAHKKYPDSFKTSEETKKKISESMIKYLKENPDKVPYKLNHYSKGPSYPEKYFKEVFDKENVDLTYHERIYIYELDFANIEKKIDVEVDGDQHYLDKRIKKSDERRNLYLQERGWVVFRIKWNDYQKLTKPRKNKVIKEIKLLLNV